MLSYHAIRSNGAGCPPCARRRVGGLRRLDPDDAAQLMRDSGYEPLTPYPGSGTPWACRCVVCGHETTPTYGNVKAGYGCMACGRRRTAEAHRHDVDQATDFMRSKGFQPLIDYPGAGAPWPSECLQCLRHVQPRYASVRDGARCRYCARKAVDPADAVQLMEKAGLSPLEPYPGSAQPWRCLCRACGSEVTPRYAWVRATGSGCRFCGIGRRASARRIDPEDAAEAMRASGWLPLVVYPGASTPWQAECMSCGRESMPTLTGVRSGHGCRRCAADRTSARFRLNPDGAVAFMRAAGLQPLDDYPGAGVAWHCECMKCGNEVSPRYNAIKQGQGGCGHCAGNVLTPDTAEAVMRAAGFEPLTTFTSGKADWLCKCAACERLVTTSYASVRSGHGCSRCWEDRRGDALRLDPAHAVSVMRAAGFQPLEPYPGSGTPWPCTCSECGRQSSPSYGSARAGSRCRFCSADSAGVRQRRAHASAAKIMLAAGLEPMEAYTTANTPWKCRCLACGSKVTPTFSRIRDGGGCRVCSRSGYDFAQPGRVYVMVHNGHGAVKIGIASLGIGRHDRIHQHAARGWELVKVQRFDDGEDAWNIEQAVLRRIRAAGWPPFLTAQEMPQGGATETFCADGITPLDLWQMVCEEYAVLREARRSSQADETGEQGVGS